MGPLVRDRLAGFEQDIRAAIDRETSGPLEKLGAGTLSRPFPAASEV